MGVSVVGGFVPPFKLLQKKLGEFKRVHNALFPISPDLLYNASRHGRKEDHYGFQFHKRSYYAGDVNERV